MAPFAIWDHGRLPLRVHISQRPGVCLFLRGGNLKQTGPSDTKLFKFQEASFSDPVSPRDLFDRRTL